jgi:myo-inositol-1(or 4)-monophosphatase
MRRDGTDEALRPSAATRLVDVNLDAPYPNHDRFQAVRMLAEPAFTAMFPAPGPVHVSGARVGRRPAAAPPTSPMGTSATASISPAVSLACAGAAGNLLTA